MEIGILITNEREYDEAFDWDYDYIEGFPGMLGPDEDDAAAERECRARIEEFREAGVTTPLLSLMSLETDLGSALISLSPGARP